MGAMRHFDVPYALPAWRSTTELELRAEVAAVVAELEARPIFGPLEMFGPTRDGSNSINGSLSPRRSVRCSITLARSYADMPSVRSVNTAPSASPCSGACCAIPAWWFTSTAAASRMSTSRSGNTR